MSYLVVGSFNVSSSQGSRAKREELGGIDLLHLLLFALSFALAVARFNRFGRFSRFCPVQKFGSPVKSRSESAGSVHEAVFRFGSVGVARFSWSC